MAFSSKVEEYSLLEDILISNIDPSIQEGFEGFQAFHRVFNHSREEEWIMIKVLELIIPGIYILGI